MKKLLINILNHLIGKRKIDLSNGEIEHAFYVYQNIQEVTHSEIQQVLNVLSPYLTEEYFEDEKYEELYDLFQNLSKAFNQKYASKDMELKIKRLIKSWET